MLPLLVPLVVNAQRPRTHALLTHMAFVAHSAWVEQKVGQAPSKPLHSYVPQVVPVSATTSSGQSAPLPSQVSVKSQAPTLGRQAVSYTHLTLPTKRIV